MAVIPDWDTNSESTLHVCFLFENSINILCVFRLLLPTLLPPRKTFNLMRFPLPYMSFIYYAFHVLKLVRVKHKNEKKAHIQIFVLCRHKNCCCFSSFIKSAWAPLGKLDDTRLSRWLITLELCASNNVATNKEKYMRCSPLETIYVRFKRCPFYFSSHSASIMASVWVRFQHKKICENSSRFHEHTLRLFRSTYTQHRKCACEWPFSETFQLFVLRW